MVPFRLDDLCLTNSSPLLQSIVGKVAARAATASPTMVVPLDQQQSQRYLKRSTTWYALTDVATHEGGDAGREVAEAQRWRMLQREGLLGVGDPRHCRWELARVATSEHLLFRGTVNQFRVPHLSYPLNPRRELAASSSLPV